MSIKKLLVCLVLALSVCSAVFALADAAVEEFWSYAYSVDKTIYVNASDGLGLYMRYGPGTEYAKVNSRTIPNGTAVHITQECTAENGWKWGWCDYTFPGQSYADSGWICLVETTTKAPASPAQSGTQTSASQVRSVDRVLYIQTSDGLGLYMRTGPGTEYSKVNSRTIPNGTAIHITQECTAANGWNWGWCSYQFPGRNTADSGWCCLVETTTQAPTAAVPVQPAEPAPVPAAEEPQPAEVQPAEEEIQTAEVQPVEDEAAAETAEELEAVPAAAQAAPATYSSMSLVIIGIVVGVVAAAAVGLILSRRKK